MKKATAVVWLYEKMVWDYSPCGIGISTPCFWVYSKPDLPYGSTADGTADNSNGNNVF